MKVTIHKFGLSWVDDQVVSIPGLRKVLTVQPQDGSLYLWAEVDDFDHEPLPVRVLIVVTGREVPQVEGKRYLGTIQTGRFVWHLYYLAKEVAA